jgi:hypothetical protein
MEYRGKRYTIVQGIGAESWTWTVHFNQTTKVGKAKTRQVAVTKVVRLIDGRACTEKGAVDLAFQRSADAKGVSPSKNATSGWPHSPPLPGS